MWKNRMHKNSQYSEKREGDTHDFRVFNCQMKVINNY
jgi:hypothetical protein